MYINTYMYSYQCQNRYDKIRLVDMKTKIKAILHKVCPCHSYNQYNKLPLRLYESTYLDKWHHVTT